MSKYVGRVNWHTELTPPPNVLKHFESKDLIIYNQPIHWRLIHALQRHPQIVQPTNIMCPLRRSKHLSASSARRARRLTINVSTARRPTHSLRHSPKTEARLHLRQIAGSSAHLSARNGGSDRRENLRTLACWTVMWRVKLEQRQGGSSSRPRLFRGRSQRCRRPLGWRRWWTKASRRKRIGLRPRKLDRVDKGPVLQADAVGQGWVRVLRRVWVRR